MNKFRKIRNSSRSQIKNYIANPRKYGFKNEDKFKLISIHNKYKLQEDKFLEELCESNQAQLAVQSLITKKKYNTAEFADIFSEMNEITEASRRNNTFNILENYLQKNEIVFDMEEVIEEIVIDNSEDYKLAKKEIAEIELKAEEMGKESFLKDKDKYLRLFELENAVYYYEQKQEIDNE